MLTVRTWIATAQDGWRLGSFYLAWLLLPGCPPDFIWTARRLRRPSLLSTVWGLDDPGMGFLGFYAFQLAPTVTLTGLFIQAVRALPLGGAVTDPAGKEKLDSLTRLFGAWYCPVVLCIALGSMLLSVGCIAVHVVLFLGNTDEYGHPRLTRRLIVRDLGTAALLQVLVGLAGIVLSYPEAWLQAERDRQDWRDLSGRDANLKWFKVASWLVFAYGTMQIAGIVIPMATSANFRLPVQYEPIATATKADNEPVYRTDPEISGQREVSMAILAQHFAQQRMQAQQLGVKDTSLEEARSPTANQHNTTKQQFTETPATVKFDPGTVYWTERWKTRGSNYNTRLDIISFFLISSAILIFITGVTQTATFILTRMRSKECGW